MASDLPDHLQDLSREDVRTIDKLYERLINDGVADVIEDLQSLQGS
jgi:hypothetical protein